MQRDKRMIYVTFSPVSKGYSPATKQTILDIIKFSSEIGFKSVILGRGNNLAGRLFYYVRMIKSWKESDIILVIYPHIGRPLRRGNILRNLEKKLIKRLNRNKYSILYIEDLPIEQSFASGSSIDKMAYKIEERIFKSFDVLLVYNENEKKQIQANYGIDDKKFVEFEIVDYGVDYQPMNKKSISKPIRIVYSGPLGQTQSKWIQRLPYYEDILYEFSGPNGKSCVFG